VHIRTINRYKTETLTKAINCKAQAKNVISKNDLSAIQLQLNIEALTCYSLKAF